jgi:GT2 family glycosyltransferase
MSSIAWKRSVALLPVRGRVARISAIVVAHNNRRDIGACLRSLATSHEPIGEVTVIDQRSSDGTSDLIRREFPAVRVLGFSDNPGFGEGNNRGARVSHGDYLLLLNPDAQIDPGCVSALAATLDADARAGIAVPKVRLTMEPGVLNSAGLSINRAGHAWDRGYLERDRGQFDRREAVIAGSGCALLIRASVFAAIGGFDPGYFLYYEDLDLCWRAWNHGWAVVYEPNAVAWHAPRLFDRPALHDHYFDHRNRLRTLLKNAPASALRRSLWPALRFELGSALHLLSRGRWIAAWMRTCAFWWNVVHLPSALAFRRRTTRAADIFNRTVINDHRPRVVSRPPYAERYDRDALGARLPSTIEMSNDTSALGLGWSEVRTVHGNKMRWCSDYGIAFLGTPTGADAINISIACWSRREQTLRVSVNRGDERRVTVNGSTSIAIDAQSQGSVARLEITLDAPASSEDDGIAVQAVVCQAAPRVAATSMPGRV